MKKFTIANLKKVSHLLTYSDSNPVTGVKDKLSLLDGLAGMFIELDRVDEFSFFNYNSTKKHTIKRDVFIAELREIFEVDSIVSIIVALEEILKYNFLKSYKTYMINTIDAIDTPPTPTPKVKKVEVGVRYFNNVLKLVPNDFKGFLYPDFTADAYFLFFTNGELIGGHVVQRDGTIEGVFSLKKGYGDIIVQSAIDETLKHSTELNLFCIGDFLRDYYIRHGFAVSSVIKFDRTLASEYWNFDRFGEPDLFTMVRGV